MPPNRLAKTLEQLTIEYPDSYSLNDSDLDKRELFRDSSQSTQTREKHGVVPLVPTDQLCAIAFTSGSTGKPTPNLKYWKTLSTSSVGNAQLLLENPRKRINLVATVPPQHMWGFETSILLPLFANAAVCQLSPFYPQDIADALQSLPPPRALISSPAHLQVLLRSGVQLVQLDRMFSATAPMSKALAQQLEQQFRTHVLEVFGSSESGILARRQTATKARWRLSDLFEIEVIEDGVLIRAPHLPEELLLQDVIEMSGKNHFRWLGRHQDMVNIAGKRGSLADLNRRLLAIEELEDGVIFIPDNNSGRLAALIVAPKLKPADIRRELKSEIDAVFLPRPIYMVPALPRQETGKLAHKDVMKLFEDRIRIKKSDEGVE